MNAFLALVRADLALYFSNRRALLMSIAAPILIAAFFGSLFGQGGGKPSRIAIGVTDLDQSELTQRVMAALRKDEAFALTEASADEAQTLLKEGKLRAAIVLPAGFGKQAPGALFGTGRKPEVQLAYDPSQESALPIVRGLLTQHVMQQVSQTLFSGFGAGVAPLREEVLAGGGLTPDLRRDLGTMFDSIERVQRRGSSAAEAASAGTATPSDSGSAAVAASAASAAPPAASAASAGFGLPFTTREVAAVAQAEASYNSYSHAFAGMGVQFVLLMGVDIGIGLLAMRRLGLWKRLRAAPLAKSVLLGSRVASCAVIAVVVQTIVFAVAMLVFGVRIEGSVIGFAAIVIAFSLFTASFGLLIAAIGRTPEATRGLAIVVTLLMVMVGGAWVPSFIFPAWLQQLSLVVPTRWAVDGFDAMTWRGLGLPSAVAPTAALLCFALVFGALAVWRFEWEE